MPAPELAKLIVDLTAVSISAQSKARQAVRAAAFMVQAEAIQMCPVDTGALRASIGVAFTSGTTAEVGPTMEYAPYVEYGTARMSAQPFMGPALEKIRPIFESAMLDLGGKL